MEFDSNSLTTFSELGLTLIGVAAIVGVFLARDGLTAPDRIRFIAIVLPASTVALMAFVPIWVSRTGVDEQTVWKVSSAFYLASFVTIQFSAAIKGIHPRSPLFRQMQSMTGQPILGLVLVVPLLNFAMLTVNLVSWPLTANQTMYELVLASALLQSVLQFVALVIYRGTAPETMEDDT